MISVLIKIDSKIGFDLRKRLDLSEKKIVQEVKEILEFYGLRAVRLGIVLVDLKAMASLNQKYRGLEEPTTVLSFSQLEGQAFPNPEKNVFFGDVVICPELAAKKGFKIKFLLKHGIKNLLLRVSATEDKRTRSD